MKNKERIEIIKERLQKEFNPTSLEVIDESHQHVGHAGAQTGAGHFMVIISSSLFDNKPTLYQHRMIYKALADLMPTEIHALSIKIY